jgi:5-methylthioadenosine/S-adenosylhomocysteine deaminase
MSGFLNLVSGLDTLQKRIMQLLEVANAVLSEEEIKSCLQLAMMEMVNGGVTTVLEHCPLTISRTFIHSAMENGLRVNVAISPSLTEINCNRTDERALSDLDEAIHLWEQYHNSSLGQIEVWLAHCLWSMKDPRLLKKIRDIMVKTRMRVTVDMQQLEDEEFRRRFGTSPVSLLADNDLLRPEVILAHCPGEERSKLENTGVHIVHCARIGVENGNVIPYFPRYSAIPNVAVGTDYYSNDFLAELKAVAMLGKLYNTGFNSTNAADVFYGSTVGGAKALGRQDIGRILEGYRADLVIVKNTNPFLRPMTFPLVTLVYSCNPSDIDTVLVDGRVLKQDGNLVGMKTENVAEKAEQAVLKCWRHGRRLGIV